MSFICKMNDIIFGIVSLVLKTYVKHFTTPLPARKTKVQIAICNQHKPRTTCESLTVCSGFMLFGAHQYLGLEIKLLHFDSIKKEDL